MTKEEGIFKKILNIFFTRKNKILLFYGRSKKKFVESPEFLFHQSKRRFVGKTKISLDYFL